MRTILLLTLVLGCVPPALASGESGTAIFSKRFGRERTDRGVAVSVDAAGLITIAGWAYGGVDLGSGVTVGMGTEVSERLIFLAKLDARGLVSAGREDGFLVALTP